MTCSSASSCSLSAPSQTPSPPISEKAQTTRDHAANIIKELEEAFLKEQAAIKCLSYKQYTQEKVLIKNYYNPHEKDEYPTLAFTVAVRPAKMKQKFVVRNPDEELKGLKKVEYQAYTAIFYEALFTIMRDPKVAFSIYACEDIQDNRLVRSDILHALVMKQLKRLTVEELQLFGEVESEKAKPVEKKSSDEAPEFTLV